MNKKKIKKQYDAGVKLVDIAKKNDITINQLQYLIRKEGWKRTKSNSYKNNKNAIGNKGGKGAKKNNKYAVTTGAYENIFNGVLSEEENKIFNEYEVDKKAELGNELKILLIRERRILLRIKKIQDSSRDMYVDKIEKVNAHSSRSVVKESKEETRTIAENNNNILQRLEDALTRVQEAKRRCVDSLHRIEMDEKNNPNGGTGESLADTIQKAYEQRMNAEREDGNVE